MTHPEPRRPDPIQPLDLVRAWEALVAGLTPVFQLVVSTGLDLRRRLVEAHEQRVEWVRSDEGQAALRHERDLEWIRRQADTEKRAGSRAITRMFDDLYAQHGMTRQEH